MIGLDSDSTSRDIYSICWGNADKNEPPTGAIGNTHRNVNQAEGTWMVTPLRHWFLGRALNCFLAKHSFPNIYYWLVVSTILKNMKVNGKDYPIYYGKIKNVPNHQLNILSTCSESYSIGPVSAWQVDPSLVAVTNLS